MRCFLIGSKDLSVRVLEELVGQGHDVLGVLSRDHEEDMKVWLEDLGHRSLRDRARELDVDVSEGISINSREMIETMSRMRLDILFSVFWGEIVRNPVLHLPRLGCFNLHTAYLPSNRGSFPLAWAIINGEEHAGVTIHKMHPGVDDGHIVSQTRIPVEEGETGESIYEKATDAGTRLFKETLPLFDDMAYTLTPQDHAKATYHPRGYPYGGQINPYWDDERISRFKNALHFPPFDSHSPAPPRYLEGHTGPNVRVMLGFDNDRPRGAYIASEKGSEMAKRKISSIERISGDLDHLGIPRTFFVCGEFLESMHHKFGAERLQRAFQVDNPLVEIGDHTYSHTVVKEVESRPDKQPMPPTQVVEEYRRNTLFFDEVLGVDISCRGYRTPLGHHGGLAKEYTLLDKMLGMDVMYVSSDLRGPNDSVYAPLRHPTGTPRQPYRYENGLLEIPSMGWQDTAFSGTSNTPISRDTPSSYDQIIDHYQGMFAEAKDIAQDYDRDYFLGLVLHPYDNAQYNENGRFFHDLHDLLQELGGSFCTYKDVANHYNDPLN